MIYQPHQVAFGAGQEAENKFTVPCETMKHCILDLTPVAF